MWFHFPHSFKIDLIHFLFTVCECRKRKILRILHVVAGDKRNFGFFRQQNELFGSLQRLWIHVPRVVHENASSKVVCSSQWRSYWTRDGWAYDANVTCDRRSTRTTGDAIWLVRRQNDRLLTVISTDWSDQCQTWWVNLISSVFPQLFVARKALECRGGFGLFNFL